MGNGVDGLANAPERMTAGAASNAAPAEMKVLRVGIGLLSLSDQRKTPATLRSLGFTALVTDTGVHPGIKRQFVQMFDIFKRIKRQVLQNKLRGRKRLDLIRRIGNASPWRGGRGISDQQLRWIDL